MNAKDRLDEKNKMIHGSKEKRIKGALNCLKEYRLVIDTYEELKTVTEEIEKEKDKKKLLLLQTKSILLSKKLDVVWNKWKKIEERYNCNIPIEANVPASTIFPHQLSNIFISSRAHIGEGCVIFQGVTIGTNTLKDSKGYGTPTIGNNVYIGAGATIIGNITIGDNARIGANTTVIDSVPENGTCVSAPPVYIKHNNKKENHQW